MWSMPSGSFSRFTSQSPSPALSLLRGYLLPNQPSSSTNISSPMAAASSIMSVSVFASNEKAAPSQLLSSVGVGTWPCHTP